MTGNHLRDAAIDPNLDEKNADLRTPHSIRFSDSEWSRSEQAAKGRGMTAAELVRHAAMSLAEDKSTTGSSTLGPGIAAQIVRICRGVYLLSTLKRDEMFRDGRQEELDRIGRDARDSWAAILNSQSD